MDVEYHNIESALERDGVRLITHDSLDIGFLVNDNELIDEFYCGWGEPEVTDSAKLLYD